MTATLRFPTPARMRTISFVRGKPGGHVTRVTAHQCLAGALIRALAWMGLEHESDVIEAVRGKLADSERNAVVKPRGILSTWIAVQVS
jgi:hypothetical protein